MPYECRTCMKVSNGVIDIFSAELSTKIRAISSVEILPDCGFSVMICDDCVENVHFFHHFREQMIERMETLEDPHRLRIKTEDSLEAECRTCLTVTKNVTDLFCDGLPHKIEIISLLEVIADDRFSSKICVECEDNVVLLYDFRTMILTNNEIMFERIMKQKPNGDSEKFDLFLSQEMQWECRLCLKALDDLFNIFAYDLPEIIATVASLNISPTDGCSSKICEECLKSVHLLNSFRNIIIKSKRAREKVTDLRIECRICLKGGANNYSRILSDGLPHKIEVLSFVEVLPSDRFSKLICGECLAKVHSFHSFRDQILESDRIFQERRIKLEVLELEEDRQVETEVRNEEVIIYKKVKKVKKEKIKHVRIFKEPTTVCEFCGKVLKSPYLVQHLKHHTDTVLCHICGKFLKTNMSFEGHLRLHNDQGEFKCSVCTTVLSNKPCYNRHMLNHKRQNDKPKKCPMCELRFFTSGGLKKHIRSHTGERPYPCEVCKTGFSSSNALKTHRRQHTQEMPFKCKYCDAAFKQTVLVRRHVKSKHPEKVAE